MTTMHTLASPARFVRISDKVFPWLLALTVILLTFGVAEALFLSPPDYQQGDTVRIMYVHVPSAWMSMMIYTVMAAALGLVPHLETSAGRYRRPRKRAARRRLHRCYAGHRLAVGQADVGRLVGVGRAADLGADPVFPVYRLYRPVRRAIADAGTRQEDLRRAGAGRLRQYPGHPLFGRMVEHPAPAGQLSAPGGIAIDTSMLIPLFSMGLAFTCFYLLLLSVRVKTALLEQKIRRLRFN